VRDIRTLNTIFFMLYKMLLPRHSNGRILWLL